MIIAKLFIPLLSALTIYAAPRGLPRAAPSSINSTTATPPPTTSVTTPASTTSTTSSTSSATPSPIPPFNNTSQSTYANMKALFDGNMKFRSSIKASTENFTTKAPSFMFIGCSDNRLSAGAIFNAPAGSIVSQNNMANQYSDKDLATDAALTYAIQDLKVQHVIVLGHYGCKSVETAITSAQKQITSMEKWVKPIIDVFSRSKRNEIKILRDLRKPQRDRKKMITVAPKVDNPGFKALVEENVKQSVDKIKKHSVLSTAYRNKAFKKNRQQEIEVYVHGFVYDQTSGEVKNLRVSFGPPGKQIPDVPFSAVDATKNWSGPKWLPGIHKGKNVKTITTSVTTSVLNPTSAPSSAAPTQSKK